MAEWLKAHAWKVCMRVTVSRVRISSSLQNKFLKLETMSKVLLFLLLLFNGIWINAQTFEDSLQTKNNQTTIAKDSLSEEQAYNLGVKHASDLRYFKSRSGTATALVTLVGLPLVGLAMPIVLSSMGPNEKNFKYPSDAPISNPKYLEGFTKRATKLHKNRSWKAYAITTGTQVAFFGALALIMAQAMGGPDNK